MKRTSRNILIAVVIAATAGAAQIPPEVAGNRCEGQSEEAKCWQKLANHPECYFWTESFNQDSKVSWTGECKSGLAQGEGLLQWGSDPPPEPGRPREGRYSRGQRGSFKNGKKHGRWVEGSFDGMHGSKEEGAYVGGKRQGRWAENFGGRMIHEGAYVDGKRHGHWVKRDADGYIWEEGPYVEGEMHGKWLIRRDLGSSKKIRVEARIYENDDYVRTEREWDERRRKKK